MRFLKDDIKVSKDGLIKMMDGNNNPVVQPLTRDDIEVLINNFFTILSPLKIKDHHILGKGAAASVKKGIFKPLNIPVAIKVRILLR